MPSRTCTAEQTVISLPDGRTYDFTDASQEPHNVHITVPGSYDFDAAREAGWHEEHGEVLACVKGWVHVYTADSPLGSVDTKFGPGSNIKLKKWSFYSWERDPFWKPTGLSTEKSSLLPGSHNQSSMPDFEAQLGGEVARHPAVGQGGLPFDNGVAPICADEGKLDIAVDLSIDVSTWDKPYRRRFELFHRNYASMHLDAALYPHLPTTPLPIRLLFKLPRFLFPARIRNWLISYYLSIQLLLLYSAFDYQPYLGELPIGVVYILFKYGIPIWPQRPPEWILKWQWNTMIVISHCKVAFWRIIGSKLLGMCETYHEYSPERLKEPWDAKTPTQKAEDV